MSNSNKIASLQTLSSNLLDETLEEMRLHRKGSSPPKEGYFCIAEYLLQEAMEYVTGAFEMIKSGKANASIALSRWVLEASLNLLWTVADSDKIDERLKVLAGEALRSDACLLESLAKLWPDKSHQFESKANEARRIRKSFGVEKPDDLCTRLESIKEQPGKMTDYIEALYPLYRICSATAHPSLKIWERFGCVDGQTVSKDPIDKQWIACWMATAPVFYLVVFTCCLTELGDREQLKEWWDNKVRPLLNDD